MTKAVQVATPQTRLSSIPHRCAGLIPGTSQYGYVIFIPPSDQPGERRSSSHGNGPPPLSPDTTHSVSHRTISPSRVGGSGGGSSSQILDKQHHPGGSSEGNVIGHNHYQQQHDPVPGEGGRARKGQTPPKPPRAPGRFVSIEHAAGQAEG